MEPDARMAWPFDRLFSDIDEANWAFDFLRSTLDKLGVPGPYDTRVALTLKRINREPFIRLSFGPWIVVDFCKPDTWYKGINLILLATEANLSDECIVWGPFEHQENEPKVYGYELDRSTVRSMDPDLQSAFDSTLAYLAERFPHVQSEPVRTAHHQIILEAVFDQEKRNRLLAEGLQSPTIERTRKEQYWKISPGRGARFWDSWLKEGYIGMGWSELGDLSSISRSQYRSLQQKLDDNENWTQAQADQVWRFVRQIAPGDRIIANRGTRKILGFGTVTGRYYFKPGSEPAHRLPVRWDDTTELDIEEGGWRRTLIRLNREKFESYYNPKPDTESISTVREPGLQYRPGKEIPDRDPASMRPPYTLQQCAEETGLSVDVLQPWIRSLKRKNHLILQGPPGTGKTYLARRMARHLVDRADGFMEIVQFHPSYAYEDFVQGLRPVTRPDGALEYRLVEGRFLEFCRHARTVNGSCVLIIDEINRANLSQVFGELMYLLEYRKASVPLASGNVFQIPDNVLLIGTMNTADRSIAFVDFALRRRFAFVRLMPNYDLLRSFHARHGRTVEALIKVLQHLNTEIGNPDFELGTTFFLEPDLETHLEGIWRFEIEPYLEEMFFSDHTKIETFRWDVVRDQLGI